MNEPFWLAFLMTIGGALCASRRSEGLPIFLVGVIGGVYYLQSLPSERQTLFLLEVNAGAFLAGCLVGIGYSRILEYPPPLKIKQGPLVGAFLFFTAFLIAECAIFIGWRVEWWK